MADDSSQNFTAHKELNPTICCNAAQIDGIYNLIL